MKEAERKIRYSSKSHERLHKFLLLVNNNNFDAKWFKSLTEEDIKKVPFPVTTFENFKYNIEQYLWHTYILYGDLEVKVMLIQAKSFKSKSKDDTLGFFAFCMSIKPEPKEEVKEDKKEEKPISMFDLDLFTSQEIEESENK